MQKKLKWIILGVIIPVLLIPLICLLVFISKTMDLDGTYRYSAENTEIHAVGFETARYHSYGKDFVQYVFRVSTAAMSARSELFIFQGVQFGPFLQSMAWDRFRFAYHALSDEGEHIGSVMFTPRDGRNQKQATNLMVFYSSNAFERIFWCTFTVEENGELHTIEAYSLTDRAFLVILPDLGEKDGVLRKFVKADFFDSDGNFIATMDGETRKNQVPEK